MNLFGKQFLSFSRPLPTVEKWADHSAKKATPDDLIAGVIIQSFAKHYKDWKFEGSFNQKWSSSSHFEPTKLTRKVPCKKHIEIVFVFKQTSSSDGYSSIYRYRVIGCEVNGVRVTDVAFKAIYNNWNNMVVAAKRAEEVAAAAKKRMEENENKWNLAEGLLNMKRDGLGRLMPIKTAEGEA